jgi:hypothetical protein
VLPVLHFHKLNFSNDFNRRVFRLIVFAHFELDPLGFGLLASMREALTFRIRPDDRGSLSHSADLFLIRLWLMG